MWFGWSGKTVRGDSGGMHEQTDGDIKFVTMDLNKRDIDSYYNGFANRTLWPLLHFRLDLVDYDRATREGYLRVNRLFAEKLAPLLKDSDTLWIHDYHMIPLGAMLRELGVGCKMGFFLHVPMPSADLMQAMPDHARLFSTFYDTTWLASRPSAMPNASRRMCACSVVGACWRAIWWKARVGAASALLRSRSASTPI